MKILFLAHRTPYPPNKGDKIRSYHILSHLAQRHAVSLAYWVDDRNDMKHTTVLSRICSGAIVPVPLEPISAKLRALSLLARGRSFSEGYYYSRRFQTVVDRLVAENQPDLIYVFSSAMARYVVAFDHIPVVIDFVDVDSDKWGQLSRFAGLPFSQLYRIEQRRLAEVELGISRWARLSLFVSDAEADLFRQMGGQGQIEPLPNGIDVDLKRLPRHRDCRRELSAPNHPARPIKLLFVGTMNYFPNVDAVLYFARDILPKIHRRFPEAVFEIVGRDPSRAIRRLDGENGIRVLGEVEEVQSYLAQADISVAPLRIARGVQNKVLEAMAVGVPVVATSAAVKGIRVTNGEEVLIGDSPEYFAAQVTRLLSENELRKQVTKNAWQRVRETYNWSSITSRLDELLQSCIADRPREELKSSVN